jgi:hypothetical protein
LENLPWDLPAPCSLYQKLTIFFPSAFKIETTTHLFKKFSWETQNWKTRVW